MMVMGTEIEEPGLVTEVAETVTVLLEGTRGGAVKVVWTPLGVFMGLNEPQLPAGAQDQVTPFCEGSPVTSAVSGVELPTCRVFGGWGLKESEMAGAVMVMVALADLVLSVTEVAVTITTLPGGRAEGAV